MNKKGDFIETLSEIVTIFILILIVTVFWYLIAFPSSNQNEERILQIQSHQEKITLLNFFKTPTKFDIDRDGIIDDVTIADVLIDSYNQGNFEDFNKMTREKLGKLFEGTTCHWSLNVFYDKKLIDSVVESPDAGYQEIQGNIYERIANITLPIDDTKSLLINYGDNLLDHSRGNC